ncbi:MAG: protein kinase [Chloroflexi bacterium]|nr:protein kinase [Chloroflexota bacterium]
MADTKRHGKWEVIRSLGMGGQGQVYLVADTSGREQTGERIARLKKAIGTLGSAQTQDTHQQAGESLVGVIVEIAADTATPLAALKELLPLEEAATQDEKTAIERMKTELSILNSVEHPALIRVLDENLDNRWFVMKYFSNGTLGDRLDEYKGLVLNSLRAFRPIVDAVAALHKAGVVHRDIKPDNVFTLPSGHLVLGDCGLAIKLEHSDRITETFENVGSRDWMPGWAMGMRLANVKPNFDIFSLGKMLWSMISGRAKLQLWYHRKPQFDLAAMFPGNESIPFAQTILDKTVVEEPDDCLPDARELLRLVDWTIEALTMRFRIVDGDLIRRCLVCGRGQYRKIVDHNVSAQRNFGLEVVWQPKFRIFVCDGCGHTQLFYSADGIRPPVWTS